MSPTKKAYLRRSQKKKHSRSRDKSRRIYGSLVPHLPGDVVDTIQGKVAENRAEDAKKQTKVIKKIFKLNAKIHKLNAELEKLNEYAKWSAGVDRHMCDGYNAEQKATAEILQQLLTQKERLSTEFKELRNSFAEMKKTLDGLKG